MTLKLARLEKTRGQSNCFAINTDFQADLEMKSIRDGTDTLQSKQLLKVWGIYGGGSFFQILFGNYVIYLGLSWVSHTIVQLNGIFIEQHLVSCFQMLYLR